MAADLIFSCMHINWPLWPRFRVKIISNFLHDNELIKANLYANQRILNRRPFMNNVYWRSESDPEYEQNIMIYQWQATSYFPKPKAEANSW